jgi:hypothetical protein
MNPVGIITSWLQEIPPAVRRYILLGYALIVVGIGIVALLGVDLDYTKINMVLTIIGGYLGFQSAANVPAEGGGKRIAEEPDVAE